MKRYLALFCLIAFFFACTKETTKPLDTTYVPKGNLFFKINGKIYDVKATVKILPDVFQIFWDTNDASGSTYININIYGNLEKTYTIVDTAQNSNHATFNYFAQNGGNNIDYYGKSGSLIITELVDNKWTGTFSGIVVDRNTGNELPLTEGKFTKIAEN